MPQPFTPEQTAYLARLRKAAQVLLELGEQGNVLKLPMAARECDYCGKSLDVVVSNQERAFQLKDWGAPEGEIVKEDLRKEPSVPTERKLGFE